MKSQASQLTNKNDFINSFFLPSAEEALTDIYDQDKKINRLLDQTKQKKNRNHLCIFIVIFVVQFTSGKKAEASYD